MRAVSTINQANLIKALIEEGGYECEFKHGISVIDIQNEENTAFLWLQVATILFLGDAVAPFIYCKETRHKPAAVYVTLEGIPRKSNIIHSNFAKLDFIANSEFTAACLRQAELNVIDVVHHGIDWDRCGVIVEQSAPLREQMDKKYGDRCRIVYVGRNDPRKGLPNLSMAVDILNNKCPEDFTLLIHSDPSAKPMFQKPNCEFVSNFGSLPYDQVLQLIASCHYLVLPTLAEGFGLPLLEANALGRPAIHPWIPPLSEFSSKEFNFSWPHTEERLIDQGKVQFWILHDYPPEIMAEMMGLAVDTWKNKREEYDDYCKQARDHSKKWDYRKVYPQLLRHLQLAPGKSNVEVAKIE